ncbi:hypothetical protein N657DRAFT_629969 [Parathielavia appendiculata]|uniref:F-box domain-containing protein n=1 Tax=Parathielavia appendiculata TaxID=2587402 RepID=A0AAN6U9K2_9PEZI|nr:hypothetical protein N657DRAFT_629969 [Parathielavia appendiculata]
MASMANTISTKYEALHAADPSRLSLANLPLEIPLHIIEDLFKLRDVQKIILRPPPMNGIGGVCRLFRHKYCKIRPTRWGAHLCPAGPYHVGLKRDMFYVRFHHQDSIFDLSHQHLNLDVYLGKDEFGGILDGIERMATSAYCVSYELDHFNPPGRLYLRHLSPQSRELIVLPPAWSLEKNPVSDDGLELNPCWSP